MAQATDRDKFIRAWEAQINEFRKLSMSHPDLNYMDELEEKLQSLREDVLVCADHCYPTEPGFKWVLSTTDAGDVINVGDTVCASDGVQGHYEAKVIRLLPPTQLGETGYVRIEQKGFSMPRELYPEVLGCKFVKVEV